MCTDPLNAALTKSPWSSMSGASQGVPHQAGAILGPGRLLIVGREGVRELGEYLSSFLSARGKRVNCVMDFDQFSMVGLYSISVNEPNATAFRSADLDIVVGLDGPICGYDRRLAVNGSILLAASAVTERSKMEDIATIIVPVQALARRAMAASTGKPDAFDYQGMVGAVMFGATLAVAEQYPERCELERLFRKFYPAQFLPLLLSTYEGYDWVQDRLMRGKSLAVMEKS